MLNSLLKNCEYPVQSHSIPGYDEKVELPDVVLTERPRLSIQATLNINLNTCYGSERSAAAKKYINHQLRLSQKTKGLGSTCSELAQELSKNAYRNRLLH